MFALINYEMYVKITNLINKISREEDLIKNYYDPINPKLSEWFNTLYELNNNLKNTSLIMGLLFVLENTLLFIVNTDKIISFSYDLEQSFWCLISHMPLEFWIIWFFILISIGIAFPYIAITQSFCIRRIFYKINYNTYIKIFDCDSEKNFYKEPINLYMRLSSMQEIENLLDKKFKPNRTDNLLTILSSFLTCIIHIGTIITFF